MNNLLSLFNFKSSVISKLYFDVFHKSSLSILITLFIILFPENDKVYVCSKIIAIYSIILIFSDFGINQLLYQAYPKFFALRSYFCIRKIFNLYFLKITLNILFALIIGHYLVLQRIFDLQLVISISIWMIFYQLTAQPLISALKQFSLLTKTAFASQVLTLTISIIIFILTYNWYYVLICYPALLSLSIAVISWVLTLRFLVKHEYFRKSRLQSLDLKSLLRVYIISVKNFHIIFSGLLTWSNTIATVFLYQIPIIIFSSYAASVSATDLSYGISYLNFPLVFLRLNSIFLTLAQYLLQYKVSDHANVKYSSTDNVHKYMRQELFTFRKNLMNLNFPILLSYLLFCSFLIFKHGQSSFILMNIGFLLILSPLILFFRIARIFINKMIISFGKSIFAIYVYNLSSIIVVSAVMIFIASSKNIFSLIEIVYLILIIGLLLDYSFYILTLIKLDRANTQ